MVLTILVVNWNTVDLLKRCLGAVLNVVGETSYEIIVVDNGSTDGSPDIIESDFPAVQVIRNDANLGFAGANNVGVRRAQGRYILLLNSDTEVQGDALDCMVNFMATHPDVGIVGASLRNADGTPQSSCDLFPLRPWSILWQQVVDMLFPHNTFTRRGQIAQWTYAAPFEVDWVSGAALMIRRETVEDIGPMDEHFFMYAEEIDWCYRAKECEWKTYHLPEVRVFHAQQGSSVGLPEVRERLDRQRDRSLERFYRKHYGWTAALGIRLIHTSHRSRFRRAGHC